MRGVKVRGEWRTDHWWVILERDEQRLELTLDEWVDLVDGMEEIGFVREPRPHIRVKDRPRCGAQTRLGGSPA